MNYYIYLDDIREDDTWFRQYLNTKHWIPYVVRSYEEAVHILAQAQGHQVIIDLDHDLGESARTGYDVCMWIIKHNFPHLCFRIHSMNPVGAANMRQLLTHYGYKEI